MKRFLILLFILTLAGCAGEDKNSMDLNTFIPKDVSVIFRVSDWKNFRNDIENNSFLKSYSGKQPFSVFTNHPVLFSNLHPEAESLFCIPTDNDSFLFIAKHSPKILTLDSIKSKKVESLRIGDKEIQRVILDKNPVFTAIKDSIFIMGSSQKILMDVLENKDAQDPALERLFNLSKPESYTVFIKEKRNPNSPAFSSWTRAHLTLTQETLGISGISIPSDSLPQLLQVFEGQEAAASVLAEITPIAAKKSLSITFNDSEKLQEKIRQFRKDTSTRTKTGIFDSSSEIGTIEMPNGPVLFLRSIDASATNEALSQFANTESTFRDVLIKSFTLSGIFGDSFRPFVTEADVHYVLEINDFFVFTPTVALAEEIISAVQNNLVLKNSSQFEQINNKISSAPSLMTIRLDGNQPSEFEDFFRLSFDPSGQEKFVEKYPVSVQQFIYDRDFAHFSFHTRESGQSSKNISEGVEELFHHNLNNPVQGNPQFFEGFAPQVITRTSDNTLHLISESGKELWSKKLENEVLGDIQFIDLSKNGNRQMVFATSGALYVIDRNGKDVPGFPIRFKDAVTQPVAVFDYEGNHDYRFFVVQDRNILLYDGRGKLVKGFNFRGAKSSIVHPVGHIRMSNKDYIIIPEKKGKLHILNRMGQTRVDVAKTFQFSEIPVTYEDQDFVVITADNLKERISDKGKVSSLKLDVSGDYWFTTTGSTKVTLDDHLLRINGKLIELPLGQYSRPVLTSVSGKLHVAVTEIQEKKIYVYDLQNNLLQGFPVFGSSLPSFSSKGGKNYLTTKGDENGIIVYSF